jgi:hypothetical protein
VIGFTSAAANLLLLGHHGEIPVFAHNLFEFTVNLNAAIRGVSATTVVIEKKLWQTNKAYEKSTNRRLPARSGKTGTGRRAEIK